MSNATGRWSVLVGLVALVATAAAPRATAATLLWTYDGGTAGNAVGTVADATHLGFSGFGGGASTTYVSSSFNATTALGLAGVLGPAGGNPSFFEIDGFKTPASFVFETDFLETTPASNGSNRYLLSNSATGAGQIFLGTTNSTDNHLFAAIGNVTFNTVGAGIVSVNVAHHVRLEYTQGTGLGKLTLDGSTVGTFATTYTPVTTSIYLGRRSDNAEQYLGQMDNTQITVDDALVIPVPEPTSLALVALGAAAGLRRARRRAPR